MFYNVLEVAKYIIYHEKSEGRTVSNLRLQKLLYFIQAKFLIEKEEPCFTEKMEAWNYGPVVPIVYSAYRYYGSMPLPCENSSNFSIDESDKEKIDSMLDSCSEYSTSTLVEITHTQAPWITAHKRPNREITPESIYWYFEKV